MRAWSLTRLRAISRARPAVRPALPALSQRHYIKVSETSTAQDRTRIFRKYAVFDNDRQQALFQKIERPGNDIQAWASLLDGGLPPHLRNWEASYNSSYTPPNLSAADVAEVLLAARNLPAEYGGPFDLLYHLGFEQNRWNAVVWLIKRLVEKFPARHGQSPRFARVNALWEQVPSLAGSSSAPMDLNLEASVPPSGMVEAKSLRELTNGLHPETMSREEILRHDALGEIWLMLGSMIKACARDGETRPEVLEIIAYLHHKEVMPLSIYQSESPADKSAIHQPPLLSMLSSRILTSLSDAAWRAHEKMVIEEAKARGGDYASLRPEIPGSVYRTHVAGLRPEVWMELILWSCLHGGWIEQGAEMLSSFGPANSRWHVFSWREYEDAVAADANGQMNPWNDLEYLFKTRAATAHDAPREPGLDVTRTVSAEVVNAFIDALIIKVNVGVGERGIDVERIVTHLTELKKLLHRDSKRSTLSTGTWDSLILRLVECMSVSVEKDSGLVRALARLSPGLGEGLGSKNNQNLPAYVLDGSMAMQGLLHRALHGQIMSGSFEGALEIFKRMQIRADTDKNKSLASFMEGNQPLLRSLTKDDLFTSNLTGIEYPAFDLQIPATTLGSFLELATDAKAHEFGRWLLYNNDVDGPVIAESSYKDPHIQPALIRFAAETLDNKLLSKMKELEFEKESMRSMLDSQVINLRWDSAERILQYLGDSPYRKWTVQNLANMIRVMLQQVPGAAQGSADAQHNLERARTMVVETFARRYDGGQKLAKEKSLCVSNLLTILSAVNSEWQKFCLPYRQPLRYEKFGLPIKTFNTVLEGVAAAYGSAAARRLLGIFWPHSARGAHDAAYRITRSRRSRMRMAQFHPTALESVERQRIVVPIRGVDSVRKRDVVVYGACVPNNATIMIICRKALDEIRLESPSALLGDDGKAEDRSPNKPVDTSPRGMVVWSVRRLAELHYVEEGIINELDQLLFELGMDDLRKRLPKIVKDVVDEFEAVEDAPKPAGEKHSSDK
ncbi:hypothetical protein M409DRAFT_54398 [Zasmidium cellare ATCC 36951]|uniref:Uncharacterized protein n=1 Tax=Zasmidium cellare ATCC 36951 TaxID=1080233 RepID=A0A6A6CM24_ZASCE|nr:uncharacterized protein M409DRAFT_54398 [Zasmidium cellare ATCC 36951]KAF2167210.1 hypothetical protein M409DRAFT_54398 [Zasmidium cellare ATCC 36951]